MSGRRGFVNPDATTTNASAGRTRVTPTADTVADLFTDAALPGIDRALANASEWEASNFRRALETFASRRTPFTIEQVLEETGVPVDHANRVGAMTQAAAKSGLIERVGYTKAKRASRAGGVVAVWVGK